MNCPSCGGDNDNDATYCFTCGMALAVLTQGTVLAGRYEIQKPLGRGGMGTVYQARDQILNEPVAIKILRSDAGQSSDTARRFLSEIKLARQVSHRNVCRIHEYGEQDGLRFISMELVEGVDLRQVIRSRGRLPSDEAFDVAIQLAQGLEAIHEVGIVHRDLKTQNVMRDARGVLRVMDFGIARKVGAETTGGTLTGAIVGTPEYMSPEQAQGQKVDLRSDIYSLAVVIFEVFTGDVPFRGDTPVATLFKQVEAPPPLDEPRAARIPRSLVPVLRNALAKEPERRFAGAREMLEALNHARATAGAPPSSRVELPATAVGTGQEASGLATNTMISGVVAPGTPSRAVRWSALALGVAVLGMGAGLSLRQASHDTWGATPTAAGTGATSRSLPPPAAESTTTTLLPAREPSEPPSLTRSNTAPASARRVHPPPEVTPSPTRAERMLPSPTAPPTPASTAPSPTPPTPNPTPIPEPAVPPATTLVATPASVPSALPAGGVLQLVVVPFADASIDGEPHGRVSSSKLALSAGSHRIELTHPDYRPLRRTVTILPGETARLVVDLAEEAIRVKR